MCKLTLFVTATNTEIGKTYTTLRLMEYFSQKGYKVGAFKPIETGVEKLPQDAQKLLKKAKELNSLFEDIGLEDIAPVTFKLPAAPFVAKEDKKIDFSAIDNSFKKLKQRCDILFVEGAGGLLVPIEEDFFMVDFIEYFKAKALLVTYSKLGCINDTLLSLYLLKNKQIAHIWCINLKESEKYDFFKTTLPYYKTIVKHPIILPDNIETLYDKISKFL